MSCWQWLMLFSMALWSAGASAGSCNGRFPNPITDVCWKCIFPIKLGGIPLATLGMEDGTNDDPPLICACPEPPPVFYRIGLGISFWEPARVAEAVRTPFCSPTLGGEQLLDANPLAQAACSADCVAASSSIGPLNALFWCAGCQNSVYPMTGNVAGHESALTSSLLTVQRMHTKMHRSFISLDMASTDSMCGARARPIIKKGAFKTQMLLPRAYTSNAQFYGETTALWGAGRQYPVQGEDFSYLIFRRRTCCAF